MDGMIASPDIDRLMRRAAEFIDAGRLNAARPLLAAIGRLTPPNARLSELHAIVALKEGRLAESADDLDRAVAAWPEDAGLRKCRADLRRRSGDAAGAAADAAEAVILNPRDPEAKAILGVAQLDRGAASDARACLAEAWRRDRETRCSAPRSRMPNGLRRSRCRRRHPGGRGRAGAGRGGVTKCRRAAAVRLHGSRRRSPRPRRRGARAPWMPACSGCMGHALSSLGRHAEAGDAYAEARKLGPDDPYVRHLVAAAGVLPQADRAPADYVRAVFDGYADRFEAHLIALGYRVPGLLHAALLRQHARSRPAPCSISAAAPG